MVLCLDVSDPDGDAMVYNIVQSPTMGQISLDENNCLVYEAGNESGNDSVIIEVCDEFGNCEEMEIEIVLTNENIAPYFVNENGEQISNIALSIEVNTASDQTCIGAIDPNGDEVSIIITEQPINGTVEMNGDCLVYTPNEDYVGADEIVYQACDNLEACSTINVVIEVTEKVNQAPQAADDTDSFQYEITDINGNTDTAWVHILVEEMTVAIEALPDFAETNGDAAVIIDVLANDSGDNLEVTQITGEPQYGTVVVTADGTIEYTPFDDGFSGTDSFEYEVTDANGNTATATVQIQVNACKPQIPQGISPNGDSINDEFTIKSIEGCTDQTPEVIIYNRWGNVVYRESDYGSKGLWNGEWQETQKALPEGTYFYQITFDKGTDVEDVQTGYIEIRR